jgi:hypothetical protein
MHSHGILIAPPRTVLFATLRRKNIRENSSIFSYCLDHHRDGECLLALDAIDTHIAYEVQKTKRSELMRKEEE